MNIKPRESFVLLKIPNDNSILLISENKNIPQKLEVVAVGEKVEDVKPGDVVFIAKGPIDKVTEEKQDYFLTKIDNVLAVIC